MCGIVGLISNCSNGFTQKEVDAFSTMLFLDTLRGYDSTGVMLVENNNVVTVLKEASHGLDFIGSKEYKDLRVGAISRGKMLVGHNRAATRGNVVDKNAHPFVVDDRIVLMQNGTYKGDHSHHKNTEVDTEAVAHVIADNPNVEEALQKINASYALVWYDTVQHTLNIIRNDERPLFYAEFGISGIMFASEARFISFAAEGADIKLKEPPVLLKPGELRSFTIDFKGSYSYEEKTLDYKYKRQATDADDNEYDYMNWSRRGHVQQACAYPSRSAVNEYSSGQKREVKYTFMDIAFSRLKEYLFRDLAGVEKAEEEFKNCVKNNYRYIELIDYYPANDHKECDVYHVFGTTINTEAEASQPTTLVHWIVYGKSEAEIIDMVTRQPFQRVVCNGSTRRQATIEGKQVYLSTSYASTQEPIKHETLVN